MQPVSQRGSKRYWRKWRASERNRYKIDRYLKNLSNRRIRRIPLDEDIPYGYHKKMVHWWDIDRYF